MDNEYIMDIRYSIGVVHNSIMDIRNWIMY